MTLYDIPPADIIWAVAIFYLVLAVLPDEWFDE